MSHVDEGLLHAYLDGAFSSGDAQRLEIEAHLASCADCHDRLEDARALKDGAREVLHHATPIDVRVPPFEALHARKQSVPRAGAPAHRAAARESSSTPRSTQRLARSQVRLAWAASVVLAVGAGWMANELVRRDTGEHTAVQDTADASFAERNAAAVSRDRVRVDTEPQVAESRDRQAGAAAVAPRVVRVDSAPPPGALPAAPTETSDEAKPLVRGAKKLLERDAEREPVPAIADAMRRSGAQVQAERIAPAPTVPGGGAADSGFSQTGFQPGDVSALDALAPELASGGAFAEHVVLLNDYTAAAGDGLWTLTTAAQAAAALGRQPAGIESLQPAETETAVVDGRVLVRQRYLLDGGAQLEVIQRPAGPATTRAGGAVFREQSAALPEAGIALKNLAESRPMFRGESALAANRPGLVLLLKGPVPEEYLQAVAARIR